MEAQDNAYTPPQGELLNTSTTAFNQPKFLARSGRIGRLRYLAYGTALALLSYVIIGVAGAVIFGLLFTGSESVGTWLIAVPIVVLTFIPLMVFSWGYLVRRLNDLNHSGWLSLLMLVPLANIGLGLYAVFAKGTEGANNYGAPPPPNTRGVIILGCIMPVLAILGIVASIALPAYLGLSNPGAFESAIDNTETTEEYTSPENSAPDTAVESDGSENTEAVDAAPDENGAAETEENYGDEPADEESGEGSDENGGETSIEGTTQT